MVADKAIQARPDHPDRVVSPSRGLPINMQQVALASNRPFYCINTTYLVERCICPAPCQSRQTLEKNVLSWALAGTGSVLSVYCIPLFV